MSDKDRHPLIDISYLYYTCFGVRAPSTYWRIIPVFIYLLSTCHCAVLRQVRSKQAESTCRFFIFTLSTAGNLFIKFNKFYFYYYSKGIIKSIQTLKNSLHIHVSIRTLCNTRHHACLYVQQLERTNICTGYFQIQCMFLNNILYVNGINI